MRRRSEGEAGGCLRVLPSDLVEAPPTVYTCPRTPRRDQRMHWLSHKQHVDAHAHSCTPSLSRPHTRR